MSKFEQFIKERQYLQNVSPRTVQWYQESLKWLRVEEPTEANLKDFVFRMREKNLKPTSCNNRIRAVNAYLKWSSSPLKIPRLKEPMKVLPAFAPMDIKRFMTWKPRTPGERRLQVLVLLLADTGVRVGEALGLKWSDIDWDSLLLLVRGKGGKERRIPFSFELRKYLWRFRHEHQLLFCTRHGTELGRRDVLRDTKRLCRKLGIQVPERTMHAFRHSFAVNYLRRGGSVFHLQKCLGHTSLEMTRRYANLMTEDLQKIHQQVSLLA
ncbi:MAG TPA: tyrosine-type recombinase/integrase [Dongiaceae bacterium]|nr:tyrosine-type recombinase/integrase [Dongiaceae bacterium]